MYGPSKAHQAVHIANYSLERQCLLLAERSSLESVTECPLPLDSIRSSESNTSQLFAKVVSYVR